jgi:hypothetical protein
MRLVDGYLHFLSTGEMAADVFADEVFLDMNVPTWRLQFRGREAVRQSRAGHGLWRVHPGPVTTTADGFVVETAIDEGDTLSSRSINLVRVVDGRIATIVHYCTGIWDPATRARHAQEVTLLIPGSA